MKRQEVASEPAMSTLARLALISGLVRLKVDIIFGMDSPAAQAAKKATTTIPIVISTGGDRSR